MHKHPKNYFAILGLPFTASAKDVKRAYYQKIRVHHPDRNNLDEKSRTEATAITTELNLAYEVLSDEAKRNACLQSILQAQEAAKRAADEAEKRRREEEQREAERRRRAEEERIREEERKRREEMRLREEEARRKAEEARIREEEKKRREAEELARQEKERRKMQEERERIRRDAEIKEERARKATENERKRREAIEEAILKSHSDAKQLSLSSSFVICILISLCVHFLTNLSIPLKIILPLSLTLLIFSIDRFIIWKFENAHVMIKYDLPMSILGPHDESQKHSQKLLSSFISMYSVMHFFYIPIELIIVSIVNAIP